METTIQAVKTRNGGTGCKVCSHPEKTLIHEAIARGETIVSIALRYSGEFSRHTLHRHLDDCIHSTHQKRRESLAYDSALDLNQHLLTLMREAEEELIAAKSVLLVDGDLCFDPRAWEISVVYKDWADLTEQGDPKTKTAKLSKLLAMIAEGGKEPEHSYIKAEDMRKTLRDCIGVASDLVDKIAKVTGAYKRVDNQQEQLDVIKANIMRAAVKFGVSYAEELRIFLADHAGGLRPDLRGMLEKECLSISGPLPAGGEGGKDLNTPIDVPARPLELNQAPEPPANFGKILVGTIEVEK